MPPTNASRPEQASGAGASKDASPIPETAERAALERSWQVNAAAWAAAVRGGAIASRQLATDAAIVEAVAALAPRRVLDLGCGEGWLARALAARGVLVTGTDASPALVEAARQAGGGSFHRLSYGEIAADPARAGDRFDAVVANFALLDDGAAPLLRALPRVIAPGGALLIQTLHPLAAGPPYRDGWRLEDFRGFGAGAAWQPMPWYFRTVGSWLDLLRESGYALRALAEPLHPETALPLSLLLTAAPAALTCPSAGPAD